IGCHDNLGIAMYAIDSLKQLSMKFLEKDELRDFNFQRLFLTPFEIIMANAVATEIRELVLRVAAETFDAAAHDARVVLMGFMLAKTIVHSHFDRVVAVFVDVVECILAFALCGSLPSLSSGELLQMSLDAISELLKRWLVRESEDELAVAAATSYETLLIEHGHQFPPPIWELVTAELIAIQDHLLPHW
ncbi:hypothetical protein DYB30_011582, partial [Aphanomyces astaci]